MVNASLLIWNTSNKNDFVSIGVCFFCTPNNGFKYQAVIIHSLTHSLCHHLYFSLHKPIKIISIGNFGLCLFSIHLFVVWNATKIFHIHQQLFDIFIIFKLCFFHSLSLSFLIFIQINSMSVLRLYIFVCFH